MSKTKTIISNAFSLNMISTPMLSCVKMTPLDFTGKEFVEPNGKTITTENLYSVVGHEDTAATLSVLLGTSIGFNRESIVLDFDTQLIVAQFKGTRLPEGATSLPEGATIEFVKVEFLAPALTDDASR